MSMDLFIPEIWAQKITQVLQKSLVGQAICNTEVTGEITKKGDLLHILAATAVSTDDYVAGTNITYEDATVTDTELSIDVDKVFALIVRDEDKLQAAAPWDQIFAQDGAYQLRNDLDVLILGEYANAGLDSYETGSTAWQLGATAGDVPKLLDSLNKQLNDANAPMDGRYIVAPSILTQAFQRYVMGVSTDFGSEVLQNGSMGKLGGFEIFASNNCTSGGGTTHGLCGVKGNSIALANQIAPNSIQNLGPAEGQFGDLVRGRLLAGHKTYRAATLIDINLNTTLLA